MLHIFSHGTPGALLRGGQPVDADMLLARPELTAAISESLAGNATVILYGCSVASGSVGRRFVDLLEAELGVAVVASDGPVGAAVLGGSWDRLGLGSAIETACSPAARAGYAGLLANFTGTTGNDILYGGAGLTRS